MSKRSKRLELVQRRAHVNLLPRNEQQEQYINAIKKNDIVFGIGPAGTGKTFIAASLAAEAYERGQISKIMICRPIVEAAGEQLGFLPGDLNEKCDPYLRPIFDAFEAYWDTAEIQSKMRNKVIEISPLAYMRGRTFVNAFVVADEAQNANTDQMMMLLTRLGPGSKIVITGDLTQRDKKDARGIEDARKYLSSCPKIEFASFGMEDIVRHQTVAEILKRWDTQMISTPKIVPIANPLGG